ncbi:MAG: insulinase family protein, partial [Treponema sp.]|nr:insulinase family protein [Treponema sp.]
MMQHDTEGKIVNEFYRGFDLISRTPLPDYSATGIYVRHRKTGLEVFHVQNDDEENLFAFVFRTPHPRATGVAHIIEHSVLCGSEKFPLKEPFVNLINQSMNTFLNAFTYPDKTVYPAASLNRTDYFNVMDVYADAVFFPLLSHETFLQEAHRLEIAEDGTRTIQGVVYNEMKGAYSSFASVAGDALLRSLFSGTVYEYDSGGEPLVIPTLTYEEFRAFHAACYRPDNALLFLYGSIPTEVQLDFIQRAVLDRLEKKYPVPPIHTRFPAVPSEIARLLQLAPMPTPVTVRTSAPDTGVQGSYAVMNWRLGNTDDIQSFMEIVFIMQVLTGHDGSPISKALLDTDYGDGLVIEIESSFRALAVCIGLSGVDASSADAVADVLMDTLNNCATHGVPSESVASAVLAVDFANREVTRAGGPYALEILSRAVAGWNYGTDPATRTLYRAAFDTVQRQLAENPDYCKELIRRLFLENTARSFVVVTPDARYLADRAVAEQQLVATRAAETTDAAIKDQQAALHAYQYREETNEEASCIPH